MARKASAEAAAKPAPGSNVDYKKALEILEMADSEKTSLREAQGELSQIWKRLEEECGVHKGAAKLFNDKIKKAADDKRSDFLRTFFGLMKAAGISAPYDMVDMAEGKQNVVPLQGLGGTAGNA